MLLTPNIDQGQGAAQAIEDAAALTVILPAGTVPCEIPERLSIYEEIRYERAHVIQEYSRLAGKDWVNGKPAVDSKGPRADHSTSLLTCSSDELHQLQLRLRRH
jgi:2-polyprenyl-6-methoxyphenol hydroxylase-like FAD-dependent oxidoreductase